MPDPCRPTASSNDVDDLDWFEDFDDFDDDELDADSYPHFWTAHDHPEAPLAYGAWLCCCVACARSLEAAAQRDPLLPIVLKAGRSRPVLPAWMAVQVRRTGDLSTALERGDDWLCEVFVGPDGCLPQQLVQADVPPPRDEPIAFPPCPRCEPAT